MFFASLLRHKPKPFIQFNQHSKITQTIEPVRPALIKKMARKVNMEFANFDAKISSSNPVEDYMKLMDDKMRADVIMPNDVYNECWKKISAATRDTIWKLLFEGKEPAPKEKLEKTAELLKVHKEDACFYQAAEYNKWIVLVRDELLKRKMLDFWKNEIVEKELGLCWARDSDLFDDTEDPEPANFYKHGDCEAPWLKKKGETVAQNTADLVASSLFHTENKPPKDLTFKKLTTETPLEDYKHNMDTQGEISGDDEDAYKQIFAEAREMVWKLLFGETPLSNKNSKKAADLLEELKRNACFYNPYDYNDWIPSLRDELLKRKYFDFWQDIVVKNELGLCWARDSDFFDDMEDPKPMEFYKVGEDFIKQQK